MKQKLFLSLKMGLFFLWSQKGVISESWSTAGPIKNTSHRDTFIFEPTYSVDISPGEGQETDISFRSKLRLQRKITRTLQCYLPQRVSFYINCRKPGTHIKICCGWVRGGPKKETNVIPVITSIITWYVFCSLGGISWHRFSHQPKCCFFNENTEDVFNHREDLAKIKENPALFFSFFLGVFPCCHQLCAVGHPSAKHWERLLWARAWRPVIC